MKQFVTEYGDRYRVAEQFLDLCVSKGVTTMAGARQLASLMILASDLVDIQGDFDIAPVEKTCLEFLNER